MAARKRGRTGTCWRDRETDQNLLRKQQWDADLDAEVRSYADMLADENVRAGMEPDDARRSARLELGGAEQVKELVG